MFKALLMTACLTAQAQNVTIPLAVTALVQDKTPAPPGAPLPSAIGGAVGTTQIVVCTNSGVKSLDKITGLPDNVLNIAVSSLFNESGYAITGCHIRFDAYTQRWIAIGILSNPGDGNSNVLYIAVADTSTTNGTITPYTSWQVFSFNPDNIPNGPGSCQTDEILYLSSPTLAIDAKAVYIGANMLSTEGTLRRATAYVIQKESLFQPDKYAVKIVAFNNISSYELFYDLQGVDTLSDPNPPFGGFIATSIKRPTSTLGYYKILNQDFVTSSKFPEGLPRIEGPYLIEGGPLIDTDTVYAPHKGNLGGSEGLIQSATGKLLTASMQKKPGSDDFLLHTTLCAPVNGQGTGVTPTDRLGIYWYEIENLATKPQLTDNCGVIYDPSSTNPNSYYLPAIMTDKEGNMTISCSSSGNARFIEAVTFGRKYTDAPGQLGPEQLIQGSNAAYNFEYPLQHWGDYTYTSLDPVNQKDMYTFQQYTHKANTWGIIVAQLQV